MKIYNSAGEMARQVKVTVTEPDDLSSIPGNNMVEEAHQLPRVSWLLHVSHGMCVHEHILNR